MIEDIFSFSNISSIFIVLCIGYVVFYIIAYVIQIPGNKRLITYVSNNEAKKKKNEIKEVRKWLCLGWTIVVIAFNIYLTLS